MGEQKVPGSSLGSFCTREHETPKAPSWTSLALGPLGGEERSTRFAVWPATPWSLLLLSERGAKRQIQPYRCVYHRVVDWWQSWPSDQPPTRTHPAVIVPATKVTTTTGEVIL